MKHLTNAQLTSQIVARGGNAFPEQRQRAMTLSNQATPFGCCNYFDGCADSIMSLYYRAGSLKLLDWMGFNVTSDCYRVMEYISYVRPEQSQGVDTGGYISDPCADPNGVEFGGCALSVEDFGRFGRKGPTRDLFKPERYCKTRPRYFYDGSPVTDEKMWDMFFAMDQLLNDIRVGLITGNDTVGGQFNGLQRWVATGYECSSLDSYVVDWNGNAMDGTGGGAITLNGAAAPAGFDLVDWLLDLTRNIKQRIGWSPLLGPQADAGINMILLMPSFMTRCFLDFYACWTVCPGAQYEEIQKNLSEIRDFRTTLNGGMFGDGQIVLDGVSIPLMAYDWVFINGPTTGDMYLLTGSVGNQRIWEGEHLDANLVQQSLDEYDLEEVYMPMDGGRVLAKVDFENLCAEVKLWMRNRLWCAAPWMQVRIQDVVCRTPTGPLSPNPADTSFFPLDSFSAAVCP